MGLLLAICDYCGALFYIQNNPSNYIFHGSNIKCIECELKYDPLGKDESMIRNILFIVNEYMTDNGLPIINIDTKKLVESEPEPPQPQLENERWYHMDGVEVPARAIINYARRANRNNADDEVIL